MLSDRRLGCSTFAKVVDAVLTLLLLTRFLLREKGFDLRSRTGYRMALEGHSLLMRGYSRGLAHLRRHPEWNQGDL
jgi:hypothetical protein